MRCEPSRSSQGELPDTAPRIGQALQRRANAPLLPTKPQQPIEIGLFGESHKQTEMF
jgi:hypothetical protein